MIDQAGERETVRLFVARKEAYAVEAEQILQDLRDNFGLGGLTGLKIYNRYDISGPDAALMTQTRWTVWAQAPLDEVYDEIADLSYADFVLAVEALPGQYEQREDSAGQCVQLLNPKQRPLVRCAKVYAFTGRIQSAEQAVIRRYLINPVEAREAGLEKPESLELQVKQPEAIATVTGFRTLSKTDISEWRESHGLAMSQADIELVQAFFAEEDRDPSMTEIKVLDTYWSDHCRHTTFATALKSVYTAGGELVSEQLKSLATSGGQADFSCFLAGRWQAYQQLRQTCLGSRAADRPACLMDIATLGARYLKQQGLLSDLDESEEINACSLKITVPVDGRAVPYLLMFKNETHNHPTEIEPFGGAATCLGGAIRDPLSGRAYVYQAMRVTGSGDPTAPVESTWPGKLPQRKLTQGAAAGYSSYGNQIGLATGLVSEMYHPGYVTKRLEIGAVVAAAPADQVIRETPEPGDVVVLLGGRTGRDGIGGATGSSKSHDESSVRQSGSEVQKGNPPTERNIQRLMRRPEAARLIRRCNDFGAGGVAVAIGELADGLRIELDRVPKKYEGLDGTEIAISESQERMACVVRAKDADLFIRFAEAENLEATVVAWVTAEPRLVMTWRDQTLVDLPRAFIATNGALQEARAKLPALDWQQKPRLTTTLTEFDQALKAVLTQIRFASQKGLSERFDASIGAGTVLMPLGGSFQLSPEEGMAALIPLRHGHTDLCSVMTYGFDPYIGNWSPYHGAYWGVTEALAKMVAMGVSWQGVRLSLQEYFPKTSDPEHWGLPLAGLLGALDAQLDYAVPAIGGKDSMSGSFNDQGVPPTVVCFAVATAPALSLHSAILAQPDRELWFMPAAENKLALPDADRIKQQWQAVHEGQEAGLLGGCFTTHGMGPAAATVRQLFSEGLGFSFDFDLELKELFHAATAGLILELNFTADSGQLSPEQIEKLNRLQILGAVRLGRTTLSPTLRYRDSCLKLSRALGWWTKPLESVFPTRINVEQRPEQPSSGCPTLSYTRSAAPVKRTVSRHHNGLKAQPRVLIPVFPGTNCDYDSERAFADAGAEVNLFLLRNIRPELLQADLQELARQIDQCQILMLPGGFSAGDEPDGSGKFIATTLRNPGISEAVMRLLYQRDGLMLGICNGFQALLKLGLIPYGEIRPQADGDPTLTTNRIGRHVSTYVRTRIASVNSPWLSGLQVGDIFSVPVSHGEGRLVMTEEWAEKLAASGQIVSQYVDDQGRATLDLPWNPNGSVMAAEGLISPDGRILGKMGHSERYGTQVAVNIPGTKDQRIFSSGVRYFD
ncbi:phosphoribosylformylglycinamidine synthase [Oscillospiraceae bacterium HV4-5-C5C]|nr:phosphoribosylformylglycinamidine synthase [Oscillospiraceae bacterium HV4-5-C5C]